MEFLRQLDRDAKKNNLQLHLVGGFLRDSLAGRQSGDLDMTGPPGTLSFAREVAGKHKLKGQLIERHGLLRLRTGGLFLDISEWKGESLAADLSARDFTVNAMALPLTAYLQEGIQSNSLVDPFGGFGDVKQKILRALSGAFANDTLRILRGARLALRFCLIPEEKTIILAKKAAHLLTEIPGERILAEIITVLKGKTVGYLPLLETLGAVEPVFGKRFSLRADFVTEQTERLLYEKMWPQPLQNKLTHHLNRPMAALTRGREMIKLAAMLCDLDGIGTIHKDTLRAVSNLPLARRQSEALTAQADALSWLACSRTGFTKKEIYHYFDSYGSFGADAAILSCALHGPRARPAALRLLWEYFSPAGRLSTPPQFLTGAEMAARVGKARLPSYRTGQLHDTLRRFVALGEIADKDEAAAFAEGFIHALL